MCVHMCGCVCLLGPSLVLLPVNESDLSRMLRGL